MEVGTGFGMGDEAIKVSHIQGRENPAGFLDAETEGEARRAPYNFTLFSLFEASRKDQIENPMS